MGAQDNAELIRSGYEAFSKGDMDTVAKVFADDIRWNIGGHNVLSGTYNGQDEVFAVFGTRPRRTLSGCDDSPASHGL